MAEAIVEQQIKLADRTIIGAAAHNILGIVGNPGTGKTLLLTRVLLWEAAHGRTAFSTFHITHPLTVVEALAKEGVSRVNDLKGRDYTVKFVDFGRLLSLLQGRKTKFPLGSAVLGLDETSLGLDSREWKSRANKYLTKSLMQCRKLGLDVYFAGPLFSRIDKSLRGMTGTLIVCDKEFVYYKKDHKQVVPQYHYYIQNKLTGRMLECVIDYDMFLDTIKWYDTQEINEETVIQVDKEEDRAIFDALAQEFEESAEAQLIPMDKNK